MSGPEILRYDPRFMEEAVFFALRGPPEARTFQKERDRLYKIPDIEERDGAFQDLNLAWFRRLGLALPIEKAIAEQPLVTSSVKWCVVSGAPGKKEEGAELFVSTERGLNERERRTVRLLLRPESLFDPERVLTFVRHELLHIVDMLDPNFSYEPSLPAAEGGPTHGRLLKERYRTLWDATIDGRMVRRGWAPERSRGDRLAEFCQTFPMFGQDSESLFSRFFDQEPHTHAELVAFACNPDASVRGSLAAARLGGHCPLCGFATYSFEPEPVRLPKDVIAQITQDFSRWHPSDGLCLQCANLYRARSVSASAARLLDGSRPHSDSCRSS